MIKTNCKFCNGKIFAKLKKNISKIFLALKGTFEAFKQTFLVLNVCFWP